MTTDSEIPEIPEIDDALRRYRPAGPPPELRARVIAGTAPARRTWPWAAAAAVLLAATLGLQFARIQMVLVPAGDDPRAAAELQMFMEMLGGGDDAADEAQRLLAERQLIDLVEDARRSLDRVNQ